jgi:hypothetical protein
VIETTTAASNQGPVLLGQSLPETAANADSRESGHRSSNQWRYASAIEAARALNATPGGS